MKAPTMAVNTPTAYSYA